jgi:hypothetical protein
MPGKGSHRISHDGWSPRQIIGLVLALCLLLVLLPIGARAAGSLMTIVDSSTTNQARVQNGALRVSDLPVNATRWWAQASSGSGDILYDAGTTGKKNLMVGSLTFTAPTTSGGFAIVLFSATCSGAGGIVLQRVDIKAGETRHFDFPEPLPIVRSDTTWCVYVDHSSTWANDTSWQVKAVGYYY